MGRDTAGARAASWLFIAAGSLTAITAQLPASGARRPGVVEVVGLLAIVIGLVARVLPWDAWSPRASIALVPAALALIAVGNRFGNDAPYEYGIYFIVIFTWIGLAQPPRTSVFLAPVAAVFFVLPLIGSDRVYPGAPGAAVVTVAVCVLVGETVAWAVSGLARTQEESEHRADLLRAVARATTSITTLEWDNVLAGVVDSVTSLGFETAAFALFDDSTLTYSFVHPRGLSEEYAEAPHAADEGLAGEVHRQRATVAADRFDRGGPGRRWLDEYDLGATIGSPVLVQGHLAAALVTATRKRVRLSDEDVEAFELLAIHAGRALENALRFGEERQAKQSLFEVSLQDELTGVGNRRAAMRLLDSVQPGDGIVMIDLDHFKDVNDCHGHAAGDTLLVALADHLRAHVREPQHVARYGGEEFIVVLPKAGRNAAAVARRLVETWRDLHPLATFSAGVAVHEAGTPATSTLAKADAALYAAKRMGRDRACEHQLEDVWIAGE